MLARVVLISTTSLQRTGARPHDSTQIPLAVGLTTSCTSSGGDRGGAAVIMRLPLLSAHLLEVDAVVCTARQSGVFISAASTGSSSSAVQYTLTFDGDGRDGVQDVIDRILDVRQNRVPTNLGELGETYVEAWLKRQVREPTPLSLSSSLWASSTILSIEFSDDNSCALPSDIYNY